MSTHDWHASQYEHNKKFSNDIARLFKSEYCDWVITSLFYSALHLINEFFTQKKIPIPQDHKERNNRVKGYLDPIYNEYMQLFMLSKKSRYEEKYSCIRASDLRRAQNYFETITTCLTEL